MFCFLLCERVFLKQILIKTKKSKRQNAVNLERVQVRSAGVAGGLTCTWWTCSMEKSLLKQALSIGMEEGWTTRLPIGGELPPWRARSRESSVPLEGWFTASHDLVCAVTSFKILYIIPYMFPHDMIQTKLGSIKHCADHVDGLILTMYSSSV